MPLNWRHVIFGIINPVQLLLGSFQGKWFSEVGPALNQTGQFFMV